MYLEVYEDNAGQIFLASETLVFCGMEQTGSTLNEDIAAMLDGDTHVWTVPKLLVDEFDSSHPETKLIATFEMNSGRTGYTFPNEPGENGRRYLNLKSYRTHAEAQVHLPMSQTIARVEATSQRDAWTQADESMRKFIIERMLELGFEPTEYTISISVNAEEVA